MTQTRVGLGCTRPNISRGRGYRGRTHCYLTGPFFLVMAMAVLLHGYGLVPLGPHGWIWLGAVAAVGTALLWTASEGLLGRYLHRSRVETSHSPRPGRSAGPVLPPP